MWCHLPSLAGIKCGDTGYNEWWSISVSKIRKRLERFLRNPKEAR